MSALGRYEVLQQLGSGSMGIVYRGRDKGLGREVALKVMRTESQIFPEISERFSREASVCARLNHRNIVTIYDFGEAESSSYIVMELLQGVDWKTVVREKSPLPLALKVDLMAQVCEGLAHAHQLSIVHRDVKPSNLFVHLRTQAKILDFGLVRLSTSVLTRTGKILGTPNYMAPEQITGKQCDARSDLFSAAVVFFEFLTGCHPFQAPFIPKRIATGVPDSICEIDQRLPIALQDALSRALSKDPAQRFQTGVEFASALRSALAGVDFEPVYGTAAQDSPNDSDSTATFIASPYDQNAAELGTKPDPK